MALSFKSVNSSHSGWDVICTKEYRKPIMPIDKHGYTALQSHYFTQYHNMQIIIQTTQKKYRN